MRSLRKTKSKRNYRQMGGDGQGSRGHGYSFRIEYFGGNSKRYFEAGSPELVPKTVLMERRLLPVSARMSNHSKVKI